MKEIKQSFLKKLIKGVLVFFIPAALAIVLRVFFFEMYKIPSSSMEPTLVPGDYILVSKMSYGARLLNIRKFFKENRIEYHRAKGWGKIKKGDVFVFNWPNYYTLKDSFPNMYGSCLVKRCFGMPGDTVVIKNEAMKKLRMENVEHNGANTTLFPHDSTLNWKVDNYGPLIVPAKGTTMKLTTAAARHYRDVLLYEGFKTRIKNDSVFLNGTFAQNITFKNNYYFMKGDNFYGSQDSRYWGFVPEDNIIGKATLIIFSFDLFNSGFEKIVWNRIFNPIK